MAFKKRRCFVVADSFYEWRKDGLKKTRYRIILKGGERFVFGGIFDVNDKATGGKIASCTMITCEPDELMATIHNRIPVILTQESEDFGSIPMWMTPRC